MPIFSRRDLQRMINDNARFLTPEQTRAHVRALNRHDKDPLPDEWEVVLLWALACKGKVQHEPRLEGYAPDILFDEGTRLEFVAEIATVSDEGFEQDNPLGLFQNELWKCLVKRDLTGGGFSWKIGGATDGDLKRILKLPPRKEFSKLFAGPLKVFLDAVAAERQTPREISINTEDTELSLSYTPGPGFRSASYPAYTVAYSLTRNPVSNALKRKKKSLSKMDYGGPVVLILCDGRSTILRHDPLGCRAYGLEPILWEFLRQNTSVSGVCVVSTHTNTAPGRGMEAQVRTRTYANPLARVALTEDVLGVFGGLHGVMPTPTNDSVNASSWHRARKHEGVFHLGGSRGSTDFVTVSARELLDLLAGRLTQEEYFKLHGHVGSKRRYTMPRSIDLKLGQGRLLTGVSLERSEHEDDDWITLHFGPPDPAISEFSTPESVAEAAEEQET